MNRAARRRQERQAPIITEGQPVADVVIWQGDDLDVAECIEALPSNLNIVMCSRPRDGLPYKARNKAAAQGRAPFIVFMDADCVLQDAAALADVFAQLQAGASVVGGLLTNGEYVMAAGYAFNIEGRPYFRFARWSPSAAKVQERRDDMTAVPLQFLATRRDVFRVLRFREEFGEAAYGDADYCVRALAKGLVVYDPAIRVNCTGSLLAKPQDRGILLLRSTGTVRYDEQRIL